MHDPTNSGLTLDDAALRRLAGMWQFAGRDDVEYPVAADGFGKWMQSSEALKGALSTVTDVITGICDALSAGDFKTAGEIAFGGLKVAFLEGVAALKGIWADWKTSIQQTAAEAFLGVMDAFDEMLTEMKVALKKYGWMGGLTGYAASRMLDSPEKLRADRAQRRELFGQTVIDANESIAGANRADVQRSRDAAAAAMADLTAAINRARSNAVSPHPLDLPMGENPSHLTGPAAATEAAQQMEEARESAFRFSSVGTFSAAGASMLAGTTTRRLQDDSKKTAENAKKIAESNEKMLDLAKRSKPGLAFT